MAPPSTVVETTCSAATRPVTVAGSMVSGDDGWRRRRRRRRRMIEYSEGEICQEILYSYCIVLPLATDLYDYNIPTQSL